GKLFREAARLLEKNLGPDHEETAAAIYELAWFESNLGHYSQAEPLFEKALLIRQRRFGPQHPLVAESLRSIAVLRHNQGDFRRAEKLYLQALRMQQSLLSRDDPATATTLNNLACLYWSWGDYAAAETDFEAALRIRTRALGPDHSDTVTTLNNLGLLARSIGDTGRAERLFKRVIDSRRRALGPTHSHTLTSIYNLGSLYAETGDDAKAEPLLREALESRLKILGPDHPDIARNFCELGQLCDRQGKNEEAESFLRRGLESRARVLGSAHPETAASDFALARHLHRLGRFVEAEEFYLEAWRAQKSSLGENHPDSLRTLENLAWLRLELGRRPEAALAASQAAAGWEQRLNEVFSFAPEAQRLDFRKTVDLFSLPAALGEPDALAEAVFRTKELVLDSLLEDEWKARRSADPRVAALRAQWQETTRQLLAAPFAAAGDETERDRLEDDLGQIETELRRRLPVASVRRALEVSPRDVQQALRGTEALVEYVRYRKPLGRLQFEERYGALVVARSTAPRWIDLASATRVDARVKQYERAVRNATRSSDLEPILSGLHRLVWAPVEACLPRGASGILVSPDAQLHRISFATLLGPDGSFAASRYRFSYVGTGRDLLGRGAAGTPTNELVVFADPKFGGDAGGVLSALPGTRREAKFLEKRALGWKLRARSYLGAEAAEDALYAQHSPKVLHIATHGFFLQEPYLPPALDGTALSPQAGPMARSVLALAGSAKTFRQWRGGRVPPTRGDGVLMAQEAAALDLHATWLVTLSACDSG
ncbi:MAG: CHAT domain-containing protein, partial [Verrucomicrobiae bacterium]|nr:CHAT domain-containing protein [Verrucomicrobiae bacterium]